MRSDLEEALALQIKLAGLPEPEREYRFCPDRKWRADLAWPKQMVIVECQGGLWVGGKYVTGMGQEKMCEKYSVAASLGFRVLPISRKMIQSGLALRLLEQALRDIP